VSSWTLCVQGPSPANLPGPEITIALSVAPYLHLGRLRRSERHDTAPASYLHAYTATRFVADRHPHLAYADLLRISHNPSCGNSAPATATRAAPLSGGSARAKPTSSAVTTITGDTPCQVRPTVELPASTRVAPPSRQST